MIFTFSFFPPSSKQCFFRTRIVTCENKDTRAEIIAMTGGDFGPLFMPQSRVTPTPRQGKEVRFRGHSNVPVAPVPSDPFFPPSVNYHYPTTMAAPETHMYGPPAMCQPQGAAGTGGWHSWSLWKAPGPTTSA